MQLVEERTEEDEQFSASGQSLPSGFRTEDNTNIPRPDLNAVDKGEETRLGSSQDAVNQQGSSILGPLWSLQEEGHCR